jgi:hypothetical protein
MTQYLADHPEFNGDAGSDSKTTANAPTEAAKPVAEESKSTFAISNDVLHHSQSDVTLDPPVGSATGLELTAAAPVPDQAVAIAPGFEPTLQISEEPPTIAKDPALVTDLHHASMDFPTRFGTGEPELANFLVQASQESEKPAPSSADEFEARLSSALSSYTQPSADLPLVTDEANTPTAEFPRYRTPEPDSVSDAFEAQIEAAMHGFDGPAAERAFGLGPKASQQSSEPEIEVIGDPDKTDELLVPHIDLATDLASQLDPISSQRAAAEVIPQEDETSSIEIVSDTLMGSVTAPEPDDAVIEQMRSSLSHSPIDSHPQPMAMAAAAGAVPGGSLTANPDPEVARAIAAALAQEALANDQTFDIPEPLATPASDANRLAGAVEKVMKQELPSLVWKIMAELDLRKRR